MRFRWSYVLLWYVGLTHTRIKSASASSLRALQAEAPEQNSKNRSSIYLCTRQDRLEGRCRWCNREYPSSGGVWAPVPPYWQFPDECENQVFDVEDTKKCMEGRTLYVIGNSVARQAAFNMAVMLGGAAVKREDQRDQCPKHGTGWSDSCHNDIAGVKIKYLFIQCLDGFHYEDRNGFPCHWEQA